MLINFKITKESFIVIFESLVYIYMVQRYAYKCEKGTQLINLLVYLVNFISLM